MSYWPLLAMTGFFCMANGLFLSLLTSHYELTFGPGARSVAGWLLMATGLAGALSSFWWSAMARKVGFYRVAILTQALACPLFALLAFPASPWLGFLVAIPMSLVSPMSMYPVTVPLARNAAGLTQAMRTGILMGVPAGLSGFAVMFAGAMLRRGLPSSYLFLAIAACSLGAVLLGVWQLLAARRARKAAR